MALPVHCFPVELEFGMLLFVEGEKLEDSEKNPWSRDENQQQTQPICDARSGNRTSIRASQQIMHLVEVKMNYTKYMLYFYQVFLECEIVSKAKYCCGMGKRQRLDFCSCFLFIAPQKYFLFISGYSYFGMFFFLNRASKHQLSVASFLVSLFINF